MYDDEAEDEILGMADFNFPHHLGGCFLKNGSENQCKLFTPNHHLNMTTSR